jgi:hypothetical protein
MFSKGSTEYSAVVRAIKVFDGVRNLLIAISEIDRNGDRASRIISIVEKHLTPLYPYETKVNNPTDKELEHLVACGLVEMFGGVPGALHAIAQVYDIHGVSANIADALRGIN